MKYCSFLILAFLSSFLSEAQEFTVRHYGVSEGLPSSEVYDIFQDNQGFLWFSTDNGVVRFDGFQMKTFNVSDGLPDPVVFETLQDPNGKIWFRTFSGRIASIENDVIQPYAYNQQLAKACEQSYLASMSFDKTGMLWFTGFRTWGVIDTLGNATISEIDKHAMYYKTIENSSILGSHIHEKGVTKIVINNEEFPIELTHNQRDPKISHHVTRAVRWRDNLYFNFNNNIFKYDENSVTRVYVGTAPIISLSVDHEGNLWVGYFNNGVLRFTAENFNNPWSPSFAEKYSVTKVLQDHEGGIWFSTLENGVLYVPNLEIEHYTLHSDSKIKTIYSNGDQVITGETSGALCIIDSETKEIVKRKNFERGVLSIFQTAHSSWVSSGAKLYIFDSGMNRIKKIHSGNFIDIIQDWNDDIWGIESWGISKLDSLGNRIRTVPKRMPYRTIATVDSLLLIGLHTGLYMYDFDLNLIHSPESLSSSKISKISQLNDSTLFIATIGNGFYVAKKDFGHIDHYEQPAKNVYSIVKVDSSLWLGTDVGLLKVNEEILLKEKELLYESFTERSGLLRNQINAVAASNAGDIFAFYDNQYTVVNTNNKKFSTKKPKFYLKNLKISNKPFEYNDSFILPYDSNNIQLNFGFIAFNQQDIRIRYRLKSENQWEYTTDRIINLYALSPGEYSPELYYSADQLTWMKAPLPQIIIRPPWWNTFEFLVLLLLSVSAIIFAFFRNRLIIYKQRNEKMELLNREQELLIQTEIETLERERNRIAKDLHDSVGTNILATKLNVNRILKKNQITDIQLIDEQFQQTLVEIKTIIYDLTPPGLERYGLVSGLTNYIERLSNTTQTKITLNTFGKELKDPSLAVPAFRVIQELISNSLKHSGAEQISIHLNTFEDLLSIVYEDNGIGFLPNANQKGLGLHNIESRVHALQGKVNFESGEFGVSYTIDIPINQKQA